MSSDNKTRPTRLTARYNFPRDRERRPIFPRVIERDPYPGDVHPLRRQHIAAFLRRMPATYLYGLRRVELLPRPGEVGDPYGQYLRREKVIHLYSLPPEEWAGVSVRGDWLYQLHGAETLLQCDGLRVRWKRPVDLAYFMYRDIFLHELGHHYDFQYPYKRKPPQGRRWKEASANRRAALLGERDVFYLWHEIGRTVATE